jgi:hypothetical protein
MSGSREAYARPHVRQKLSGTEVLGRGGDKRKDKNVQKTAPLACVPDDTTSRPSKPTTFSSPHYLLGIFISGAALLPKEDQKARWKNKSRRHPTKFNSIQK